MRWYVATYNGILDDLQKRVGDHLATPRDADVWCVWQDAQSSFADIIKWQKELGFNKPTYCVQHGRGATSDYAPPNSFQLRSDKFLCWGKQDYERLVRLGYGDRAHIVGCPLNVHIKPKVEHKEKVVLYVPVNTGKEEPENIAIYYELLKLRYSKAQIKVLDHKVSLKDHWGFNKAVNVPFRDLAGDFDVVAKLLPWHDKALYHGNTVQGYQDKKSNNEILFKLLRNVDLVVGLDEGTTEVFAYGHDVPVIIVDGFKYRQFKDDGKHYETIEGYRTKAATHVSLSDLPAAIEYGLAHPEHLKQERAEIAESELGISYGNATDNIYSYIRNHVKETKGLTLTR